MAFVLEDGEGREDANAYCSLDFADEYHEDRGNAAWAALTDTTEYVVTSAADPGPAYYIRVADVAFDAGRRFQFVAGEAGVIPSPFLADTYYYVTNVSGDTFQVASSFAGAIAGTDIIMDDTGTAPFSVVFETEKEAALIKATRYMERVFGRLWLGEKSTDEQGLHWPAYGAYYWPTGESLPDDDALEGVPEAIQEACAEYALRTISRSLLPDAPAGVASSESITLPGLSRTIQYANPGGAPSYPEVEALLTGYIHRPGAVR